METKNQMSRVHSLGCRWVLLMAVTVIWSLPIDTVSAGWKLVKDEDGIRVYNQKIPGKKVKAFLAETIVEAEIRDVAALFSADFAYKDWMADIVLSKRISNAGDAQQFLYFVQDLPLVKSRDVVVSGQVTQSPKTKALNVAVSRKKGLLDKSPKYVRIEELEITFRFIPVCTGKLRVLYAMEVDPGGRIPGFIANAFAVDAPYRTLQELRKLGPSLSRYQSPDVEIPFVNAGEMDAVHCRLTDMEGVNGIWNP